MYEKEVLKEGYKYFCMECHTSYKDVPTTWHDDVSCTGADLDECKICGCDLFM